MEIKIKKEKFKNALFYSSLLSLSLLTAGLTHYGFSYFKPGQKFDTVGELVSNSKVESGVFENWKSIRSDILLSKGVCENKKSHIFVDINGNYLGSIYNSNSSYQNQVLINEKRRELSKPFSTDDFFRKPVNYVIPQPRRTGYPFAFSCEKVGSDLLEGIKKYRYLNTNQQIGDVSFETYNISQVLDNLFDLKYFGEEFILSKEDLESIILLESGFNRNLISNKGALGIAQILPNQLNACGVDVDEYYDEVAQLSCSLDLMRQTFNFLRDDINNVFGDISLTDRRDVFNYFLIQSYHTGMGNIKNALNNSNYCIDSIQKLNPLDKARGYSLCNIGNFRIGPNSLNYVPDVKVAKDLLLENKL